MPDILITEFMDESAVDELRRGFGVDYDARLADAQGDIPGRLQGVRALIVRNRTQVTADLLDAAPGIECVGRLGVGLDNIDVEACKARGVAVFPALGANNLSVAEYVITNAMILLRGAYQRKEQVLAGEWPRQASSGRELRGRTLGLVGYGSIAQDTAKVARALGMSIVAFDPYLPQGHAAWDGATRLDLDGVLAASDVVSLHVPLSEGTKHLINADAFRKMRSDAMLINTARGGVVDEDALVSALNAGEIRGAALDVFEVEPLTAEAAKKFENQPNLILTPHIAGVTEESNIRVSSMIATLVGEYLARG